MTLVAGADPEIRRVVLTWGFFNRKCPFYDDAHSILEMSCQHQVTKKVQEITFTDEQLEKVREVTVSISLTINDVKPLLLASNLPFLIIFICTGFCSHCSEGGSHPVLETLSLAALGVSKHGQLHD